MLKLTYIFFLIIFVNNLSFAKQKEIPDPFYLSTSPLNQQDDNTPKQNIDNRTLNEKFREKFHLPPTKKIYYHNIDKSNQPITMDDYYKIAADKKRADFKIPQPVFNQEDDIILPDPHFRVIRYNTPPGQRNIDTSRLLTNRVAVSQGILSPDKSKMVYTKSFFYPEFMQTASAAYFIPISNKDDAYDLLLNTNVMQQQITPIVSVGMENTQKFQFKTLFPIDFSKDSSKIAFKEKIGSNDSTTWQTNIIIYDFKSKSSKKLTAVREAIIYWWRQNKKIELKDYLWDIFPVGWDKQNPERLIVYAYAFTSDKPLFLGTWSVDYNEETGRKVAEEIVKNNGEAVLFKRN